MQNMSIWKPIEFDPNWNNVNTEKFDNIYPSWERRRAELGKNPEQYDRFIDQLKRKQAIDTGIIERMYDLRKGVTETFIKEGFLDSYLQHGDTDISQDLLMNYLKDNFDAIDFIFDFVKDNRPLSVSYIKELHSLITQHQDSTDAINQFGQHIKVTMLKGEFKIQPNNPQRDNHIFEYCPPEHVASEMDNLIKIFNNDLTTSHVLVKAAFLHYTFVQIHPFQDGNGRIARLLASFVLIKEGLFPLSIDREDRVEYIDALESADNKNFQPIVNVFAKNQIGSIERALNFKTIEKSTGYDNILTELGKKLNDYRAIETEQRNQQILNNMFIIFDFIKTELTNYKQDIKEKLGNESTIEVDFCSPKETNVYYFKTQLIEYAKQYDYFINLSLNKCWTRLSINLDNTKKYRIIISLHHYGYDNSTFAMGSFLSKVITEDNPVRNRSAAYIRRGQYNDYMDIPIGIPPLTMSSEKDPAQMQSSIKQQIELSVMAALAYIANELT